MTPRHSVTRRQRSIDIFENAMHTSGSIPAEPERKIWARERAAATSYEAKNCNEPRSREGQLVGSVIDQIAFSNGRGLWSSARRFSMTYRPLYKSPVSSNLTRSTPQSPGIRTVRRIARNPRVCGRFAITHGPGERAPAAQIAEIERILSGRDFGRSIGKARRHRDDLPYKDSLRKRRRSSLKTRRIASIVAATER